MQPYFGTRSMAPPIIKRQLVLKVTIMVPGSLTLSRVQQHIRETLNRQVENDFTPPGSIEGPTYLEPVQISLISKQDFYK